MENEKKLTVKDLTYKPKKKSSYVIANAILESLCYHNKLNEGIEVSQFRDIDFYNWIDGNEDIYEVLNKSKDIYKESTRIIRVLDLLEYKRPKYKISTEKWFETTNFSIHGNSVLKELMPLLLYYVGNCFEGSYTLFFEKLDFLIEYVIKPAIEHNETFEKERYVFECIKNLDEIIILDNNDEEISVVAIKIKLNKLVSDKVEKILVYESNEDSSLQETSINRVVLKQKKLLPTTENSINKNIKTKTISSAVYKSYTVNNKVDENIEVLLECDSYVYEYFQMKPLKNMRVFDSNEIKMEEYYFDTKEDKFYIVANDTEEMILSTVLHCLPYTVILNNDDLNEKLIQKFKDYSKKAKVDICPPPPPNESSLNSDNKIKKEEELSENKSKKERSKEQIEEENRLMRDYNENIGWEGK